MNAFLTSTRRNRRAVLPRRRICFTEVTASNDQSLPPTGNTTLRFHFGPIEPAELGAIRDARRSMIREESTRGVEGGEPALAEATFCTSGVSWEAPLSELAQCRDKLARLMDRANLDRTSTIGNEVLIEH